MEDTKNEKYVQNATIYIFFYQIDIVILKTSLSRIYFISKNEIPLENG